MATYPCPDCKQEFDSVEAVRQHRNAKHYAPIKKNPVKDILEKNKMKLVAVVVLVLLGAGAFELMKNSGSASGPQFPPRLSANPMHIHSTLILNVNGQNVPIPVNVGIGRVHQPLHTHEADNVIHVESSDTRDYTLGNFFQVWGKKFSSSCMMDYCAGDGKTLKMKVNGAENTEFEKHVLRDGETIVLDYG